MVYNQDHIIKPNNYVDYNMYTLLQYPLFWQREWL